MNRQSAHLVFRDADTTPYGVFGNVIQRPCVTKAERGKVQHRFKCAVFSDQEQLFPQRCLMVVTILGLQRADGEANLVVAQIGEVQCQVDPA